MHESVTITPHYTIIIKVNYAVQTFLEIIVSSVFFGMASLRQARITDPFAGYACCDLRHFTQENWISDSNDTAQTFMPAGTLIQVSTSQRRYRVAAKIPGGEYRFGIDDGYQLESLNSRPHRMVSSDNRQVNIDLITGRQRFEMQCVTAKFALE